MFSTAPILVLLGRSYIARNREQMSRVESSQFFFSRPLQSGIGPRKKKKALERQQGPYAKNEEIIPQRSRHEFQRGDRRPLKHALTMRTLWCILSVWLPTFVCFGELCCRVSNVKPDRSDIENMASAVCTFGRWAPCRRKRMGKN